jgi:redox-sensitive bicupin YhaK (pirin superfamily)
MENTDKIIENAITNSVLHKANTGHANHGWLESYHTLVCKLPQSRTYEFCVLRVLNDDRVSQVGFWETSA